MNSNSTFFVILGRGRSGTTLLSNMLNAHSEIMVPGELFFIINLYKKYSNKNINDSQIINIVNDIYRENRFKKKNFDKQLLLDYLFEKSPNTFSELCLSIYENLSVQSGKMEFKITGDKNPHYAFYIKQILSLFKDVKFIYIIRDYRDNVLSYRNVNFDMNNINCLAHRWNIFNRKIFKYYKLYPHMFSVIKYEDLITNTLPELNKICDFLGVDYESTMPEFYKNKTKSNLSFWHKNIESSIIPDNLEKWKDSFNKKELKRMDFVCRKIGSKFGYTKDVGFSFKLFIETIFFKLYVELYSFLEFLLFYLPFNFKTFLVNRVRGSQKTDLKD